MPDTLFLLCLSFSPAGGRPRPRPQWPLTWGSLPKTRLRGLPPAVGAGQASPSLRCTPTPQSGCTQPLHILGAGSPVLTAVVSAGSWIWGHYPGPWAAILTAPARHMPTQGSRSASFSLLPPLGNREGLCLTYNTQLYVNTLPLLGSVGCTHSP